MELKDEVYAIQWWYSMIFDGLDQRNVVHVTQKWDFLLELNSNTFLNVCLRVMPFHSSVSSLWPMNELFLTDPSTRFSFFLLVAFLFFSFESLPPWLWNTSISIELFFWSFFQVLRHWSIELANLEKRVPDWVGWVICIRPGSISKNSVGWKSPFWCSCIGILAQFCSLLIEMDVFQSQGGSDSKEKKRNATRRKKENRVDGSVRKSSFIGQSEDTLEWKGITRRHTFRKVFEFNSSKKSHFWVTWTTLRWSKPSNIIEYHHWIA